MATQAQILANRQNALKSTGPRTAEGKAVSRYNALKTGIRAESLVIPGENAAELEQLTAEYDHQFQPANAVERFLVDSLVNADWQLRRYRKVEAELWEKMTYAESVPLFTRLHRRIESIERTYHRSLRELQRLQRNAQEAAQSEPLELASFGAADLAAFLACPPAAPPAPPPAARADSPKENPALRL